MDTTPGRHTGSLFGAGLETVATPRVVRQALALRGLPLIVLVAFVLRAAVAVTAYVRHTTDAPDSMTYVRPATSIVQSGRFDTYGAPELTRTPGYPLLLAAGDAAGNMIAVALGVQVGVNCLTIVGVAALALAIGGGARVAIVAAAIYAMEPSSIIYVSKVLSETLFTALVTGLLVAFTCWIRGGDKHDMVIAGVFLAAGCFVRPILYYAPLVLGALGVIAWRRHRARGTAFAHVMLFVLVAAAPIVAWRARNALLTGYTGFAAITDVNLMEYRAAGVIARRSGEPIEQVQRRIRGEWDDNGSLTATDRIGRGRQRAARYYGMRAAAIPIIVGDPIAAAADAAAGAARTIFGRDTSEWSALFGVDALSSRWELVKITLTLLWLPVLGLALFGLVRGSWDVYGVLPGVVLSAYLITVSAGPEAYSRFRLALVPMIAVLAASGAISAYAMTRRTRGMMSPG